MTLLSIPNYTDFIIVHLLLKTEISESGLDRYFEFFNTFPQGNMENQHCLNNSELAPPYKLRYSPTI